MCVLRVSFKPGKKRTYEIVISNETVSSVRINGVTNVYTIFKRSLLNTPRAMVTIAAPEMEGGARLGLCFVP